MLYSLEQRHTICWIMIQALQLVDYWAPVYLATVTCEEKNVADVQSKANSLIIPDRIKLMVGL